jgi:hypothetical protein
MSFASAYFDEQRRKQAEAGVHFLLVTLSLGKQRKVTRLKAKQNITNNKQPSVCACMPSLPLSGHRTKKGVQKSTPLLVTQDI